MSGQDTAVNDLARLVAELSTAVSELAALLERVGGVPKADAAAIRQRAEATRTQAGPLVPERRGDRG